MFKNPLKKYASGGVTSTQEQKLVQIFSKAASKLNIKPEVLVQKVQELTGEQQMSFVQAIQDVADSDNPKPESLQLIQSMFGQPSQSFEKGGKIHDFICKHAKGGHMAGCGCKEDGGEIELGEKGYKVRNGSYSAEVKAPGDTLRVKTYPSVTQKMQTYPNGAIRYTTTDNRSDFTTHRWDIRNGQPSILQRILYGNKRANPFDKQNWREIIANHPEDPRNVPMHQDGGLMRAKSYYAKHANAGIVRKLQNFLLSRGYDVGDLDGIFGQRTYNAIRQYQRDNGLVDDGMWGEDTNQVHRVLGAGDTTFNGPRSGAHPGKHTYTSKFKGQTTYATPEQEDAYLRQITNRAYNDTNWFWGDTSDANAARDFLYRRKGGNEFIQDIYENYTSPELQQKIAYSKLPVNIQQRRYNQGITTAIDNAGQTGAKVGAAIGGTMLAAEAIPYLVEAGPEIAEGLKGVWNPAQARTGTFFHRIPNGSMVNNATGQFVSDAGMNLGQFTSGTDYAATIANNLKMITPYGFKKGGKIEKAQEGTILDYYRNKWDNDWNRVKTGWNNFKNSAPGKIVGAFIPNPNSETGMLGAAAPIGKVRIPTQNPYTKESEVLSKAIKEGVMPKYNVPKYSALDYDIDKLYSKNFENFENNINMSDFVKKNSLSNRFINYLKNDVLPHKETDWLKYGLGAIGGATAEAALIKHEQNKEKKNK